ncbi:lipopolysaccharide biosynthesis protein [Parvibaculum sp.]|uniref:lipopolysaccharide biosynthesis protein n=1 Tax=Parvibaculum sp. TaxID=2024848 RepID=UPI002623BD89|nr:lipopolysaccharide biosynthesis protein [Parvibaculum sp.]MCW5726927.1 lipopolysaccharide biosynthesis protein [Parvibaculum sp.]
MTRRRLAAIQAPIKAAMATYKRHKSLNLAFADQAMISATNFLTGILVARALGITDFGIFSLVWLGVLFTQSLQQALITSPMLSIGAKESGTAANSYFGAILVQQIALAAIFSISLIALALAATHFRVIDGIEHLILPLASCVFFTQMHEFLRRVFFMNGDVFSAFLTDAARNIPQIAIFSFFLMGPGSIRSVEAALLIISGCAGLGIIIAAPRAPSISFSATVAIGIFQRHFHFSKWLVGSALLQWTGSNIFILASGAFLGPAAAGALRAAQTLVGVTHIFFQATDNIFLPKAARIFRDDGDIGLRRLTRRVGILALATTGTACALIALPSTFWLNLLYGQEYAQFGFLVVGYAASYMLMACSAPYRLSLLAREYSAATFSGYIISTAFSLIACYPLVNGYGLHGAILGIIVTQGIMLANFYWHHKKLQLPRD